VGVFPSSLDVSTFMAPESEQISCMDCGLTRGDAIATPIDSAKPHQHEAGYVVGAAHVLHGGIIAGTQVNPMWRKKFYRQLKSPKETLDLKS